MNKNICTNILLNNKYYTFKYLNQIKQYIINRIYRYKKLQITPTYPFMNARL